MRPILTLSVLAVTNALSAPALAYVGPSIGVGAFGVLSGVLLAALLALLSVFWYLPKRLLRKRKKRSVQTVEAAQSDGNA